MKLQLNINLSQVFILNFYDIKQFQELVASDEILEKSYVSVSVDAGFKEGYNLTHGLTSTVDILNKIHNNIDKIVQKNKVLDVNTTYLLTTYNCSLEEIYQSIKDLSSIKVNTLRFSFPQVPRNYDYNQKGNIFIKDKKN